MNRENLAINLYRNELIEAIKENSVVVVEAPTGSGKTTQLPQILFNAGVSGWDTIGVTQPRRIAAYSVSKRIAEEMEVKLGQLVGYKMRFDDYTSQNTKIKIMTDGILLEELRSDPLLMKYSVIIVDEAHERSLNIDFILGLLKEILKKRKDFKVVVSSATINAEMFSRYFDEAKIISVETRPYPVEVKYLPLEKHGDFEELQEKISSVVFELEDKNIPGDVLIFLTGEGPIKECCQRLQIYNRLNTMEILPIYGRLSPEEQNRVFNEYEGKRKVVVATNIAETSITIDGIVHVIDPGFCKINYYNPRTFTSYLETKAISQASCNQRKGRAGRTAPGVVYRLYSKKNYQGREEYTKEEIYRTDLSEVVLRMADLGIYNFNKFDFISPPNKGAINSALETLDSLQAIDADYRLTEIGKKMVDFPLGPRHSRILFEALLKYPEIVNKVLITISFLSTKSPFLYPQGEEIESRSAQKKLAVKGGDFFSWINLFYKYTKSLSKERFCKKYYLDTRTMKEIVNIHAQLRDMVIDRGYTIKDKNDNDKIMACIGAGLRQFICKKDKKKKNSYSSPTEKDIRIHPGSYLYGENPEWIIGGEIVNTGRTYVRSSAMVPEKIIREHFADEYLEITQRSHKKDLRQERKVVATATTTTTTTTTKKAEPDKIQIFDKYFEMVQCKKERLLDVPYHIIIQLKSKKARMIGMDFGKIRCRLMYKDIQVLKDKFTNLVQYFDKIDLDSGINTRWPKNETFMYPNDWTYLFRHIKNLGRPTLRTKKARRSGFLTLKYLGEDSYEYYLDGDFFSSIECSIEALEAIFDSDIAAWDDKEKKQLEYVHHKLINYSEDIEV